MELAEKLAWTGVTLFIPTMIAAFLLGMGDAGKAPGKFICWAVIIACIGFLIASVWVA